MTRLLLVDDHASFRQALGFLLAREPDMEVVGQAGTVAEAAAMDANADVALVDLELPDGTGEAVIEALRARNPAIAVFVLTASVDRARFARAVEAGAAGVIQKNVGVGDIVEAIRKIRDGEPLISAREVLDLMQLATRERVQRARSDEIRSRLTPREREILQALAEGHGNKEIARRLHITVETQRTHMVNILSKLEAHSQLQALVQALRHDIVEIR
jgi:two-component system nitrate/nitrite response regulator NarL